MPEKPKAPKHTYWRGDVLWARFVVAGQEVRESLGTSSVKAAARRVTDLREQAIGRARFAKTTRTWHDAIEEWATYISGQVGARTAARYAGSLKLAKQWFGSYAIADIDRDAINGFVNDRQRGKVTNATIKRDLQALSSLLGFAEDQGWREGNPAREKMRKVRERRDPICLPTEEDYEFVLSRLQPHHAEFMRAARATGMRQDELVNCKRTGLNVKGAALTFIGKGNKQRTISLSPEALAIFERQPASMKCPNVFHHNGEEIKQPAFVYSRARRAAQKAAQKAKRPFAGFRFHDLRHLYAVEFLRAGGDLYTLQAHLRHSSVKTTEEYTHFLTPEEAAAVKKRRANSA